MDVTLSWLTTMADSGMEADRATSGELFNEAQMSAIAKVVQRLLDKTLNKDRGGQSE